MLVTVKCLGCARTSIDIGGGVVLPRYAWDYWLEAENGLCDMVRDDELIEDGVYEMDYFDEEKTNEQDLLGSSPARQKGSRTKCEICRTAARCWT